jgi:alpha-ribazole phosphatase
MANRLWLLRHARVELAPGLCYGCSEVPAHDGHTQASARAAATQLPQGLPMWVSALGRAQQMADALQDLRPDLGAPRSDRRLNEMDFGQWELQAWDAIPRDAFDAWTADFAHHRFGGTESTQAVIDRVAAALADWRALGHAQGLWITHAGVIRALQYLRTHGSVPIRNARQWPTQAPAPGGLVCLEL